MSVFLRNVVVIIRTFMCHCAVNVNMDVTKSFKLVVYM